MLPSKRYGWGGFVRGFLPATTIGAHRTGCCETGPAEALMPEPEQGEAEQTRPKIAGRRRCCASFNSSEARLFAPASRLLPPRLGAFFENGQGRERQQVQRQDAAGAIACRRHAYNRPFAARSVSMPITVRPLHNPTMPTGAAWPGPPTSPSTRPPWRTTSMPAAGSACSMMAHSSPRGSRRDRSTSERSG